ncbi:hypothetical protein [Nocardia sp. NPDC024068]|uniref:hypothetical protein n=1 Tax=Nocardia sp. NPDC024068 TaxID=3157197 RepID=UPI0033C85661
MSSFVPWGGDRSGYRTWIVVGVCALCCCCGLLMAGPMGTVFALGKKDFHAQCDIARGPASGSAVPTTTAAPDPETAAPGPESESSTVRPTANPYASPEIDPDDPNLTDRERACLTAMRVAPRQGPPLRVPNTGIATNCAAELAVRYPEAGGVAQMAEYVRDVIYSASAYATSGQCAPIRAPQWVETGNCGDPANRGPVVLPETVGVQGFCGQVVDPAAASPGDLVFWDYRDDAATRAGIVTGPGELVTVDSGKFVRMSIPQDTHFQLKRVLGEGS